MTQISLVRICSIPLRALAITYAISVACLAQPQQEPKQKKEDSVKKFLQDYLRNPRIDEDRTTRYSPAFVDLREDGTQEVIVYLRGPNWCGNGGCTTLILIPEGPSYGVVAKITIAKLPIRVLTTKSYGWHDIAVRVQGGGIAQAYEARLSFNGKRYPSNPSVPPAQRLTEKVAGEVVIPPEAEGTPLYR